MQQKFLASLCHEGIRGGRIAIGQDSIVFTTGTLTLSPAYRHLVIPKRDIHAVEQGHLALLPTVTIRRKSGTGVRSVVFCRRRFLKALARNGVQPSEGGIL